MRCSTFLDCSSIISSTYQKVLTTKIIGSHDGHYLIHNGIKDFSANQIPWNRKFSINQPHRRVMGILHVETREVEVGICMS